MPLPAPDVQAAQMDLPEPDLHLRPHLIAAGVTDGELRRWRRARSVTRVRRGAYVRSDDGRLQEPATRHALAVRAALGHVAAGSVVSHVSAAVVHGLPVWDVPLDRVHVTRDGRGGGRRSRGLHLHVTTLDPAEVVRVDGIAVTSVARTVVDMARAEGFEQAVVVADGALRAGSVHSGELALAGERARRWPGGPRAVRVVAFADGRAESPGESRSRVAIQRAGLPAPVPQWEVRAGDGRLIGRVDFGWPQLRTVGEFDGRVKYGRLLRPGRTSGDAVFAEKVREDELRAERLWVARWIWDDLDRFERIAARLERGFAVS